jgi:hypothetical protein
LVFQQFIDAMSAKGVPSIKSRGAKPIPGATLEPAQQPAAKVETTNTAKSRSMRRHLGELGYSEHAINNMDPAEAHERVINAVPPENLGVALELAGVGIPVFPARVHFEDGKWKKQPYIKGILDQRSLEY